jgi:UDP-N-acetylmuramoyl-L-alanyl-D-glutamate--2,6-diaminopimelate ligase
MNTQKLIEILPDGLSASVHGDQSISVSGITLDSRKVEAGYVYAALRGTLVDGHQYIDAAIDKGATVILCEEVADHRQGVTYITTTDVRTYLGMMAARFYQTDASDVQIVGVTGTNGKTTVATLLHQLYTRAGYKVGLISTVVNLIGSEPIPASHTTPDVVSLHNLIAQMIAAGCQYIFMEVSSHAVDQKRIAGLRFEGALFTNIRLLRWTR